jgi:hypothetical protein
MQHDQLSRATAAAPDILALRKLLGVLHCGHALNCQTDCLDGEALSSLRAMERSGLISYLRAAGIQSLSDRYVIADAISAIDLEGGDFEACAIAAAAVAETNAAERQQRMAAVVSRAGREAPLPYCASEKPLPYFLKQLFAALEGINKARATLEIRASSVPFASCDEANDKCGHQSPTQLVIEPDREICPEGAPAGRSNT